MGGCLSSEAQHTQEGKHKPSGESSDQARKSSWPATRACCDAAGDGAPVKPPAPAGRACSDASGCPPPAHIKAAGGAAECAPAARGDDTAASSESGSRHSCSRDLPAEVLERMNSLLLQLQLVSTSAPGLVLPELAEKLVGQLPAVDLCSVAVLVEADGGGAAGVLMAAHGEGADVCEATPVMRACCRGAFDARGRGLAAGACCRGCGLAAGGEWSALRQWQQPEPIYVASAGLCVMDGESLPRDMADLHAQADLCSFLSVPVTAGSQVLGSLLLAAAKPGAFDEPWWRPMAKMAGTALLPHLRNRQLLHLCRTLVCVDSEEDPREAVGQILYGVSDYLRLTTNTPMAARLGLVHQDMLLMIEQDHEGAQCSSSFGYDTSSGDMDGSSRAPARRVMGTEIPLAGTLLSGALATRKARFVSDCALYFQRAPQPAGDIFTPGSRVVSSLVVVPLIAAPRPGGGTASGRGSGGSGGGSGGGGSHGLLGGFYFALEAPDDFSQLQAPILGVVSTVAALLQRKLDGARDHLRRRMLQGALGLDSGAAAAVLDTGSSLESIPAQERAPCTSVGSETCGPLSSSLSFTTRSKRLNTDAILKAVQHKLVSSHSNAINLVHGHDRESQRTIEDLELLGILGRGGFGLCYRANLRGALVAVKVLYAREQRAAMKDAVEMAVLSHIRHPGIVSVYNCFTDVVEDACGADGPHAVLPRYRFALPDEDGSHATCNMIIMEYCDLGTLRDAIKGGMFHQRVSDSAIAVDIESVYRVLLQVARAVEYLHGRALLHCDIKLDNVLLKSDPTHEMGFVCKLADFGLTKLMNEHFYVFNRSGSGTLTHLAPEALHAGSKLTGGVDAYAFGILMYELYTGRRAYAGLPTDKVIDCVARGVRPSMPRASPPRFSSLVAACWAPDPAMRPQLGDIVATLKSLLQEAAAAAPPAPPGLRAESAPAMAGGHGHGHGHGGARGAGGAVSHGGARRGSDGSAKDGFLSGPLAGARA